MEAAQAKDLVQELHKAGIGPIDRVVVEQILSHGPECVPLLLDVLNSDVDDAVVARSLALLGEAGDPSVLERIFRYFPAAEEEDDAVTECAEWATRRISRRMPAETLAEMTRLGADGDLPLLSDICKTLAAMPAVPGRAETLLGFGKRFDDLEEEYDEALLAVTMVITAMFVDGPRGELVDAVRKTVDRYLDRSSLKDVTQVEQELLKHPHNPDDEHEPDVYTLVCEGFDEEPTGPVVREEPKIGRNDPCPCGSGKKYKKCHGA